MAGVRLRLPWPAVRSLVATGALVACTGGLVACTGGHSEASATGAEALSDPSSVAMPLGVRAAEPETLLDRRSDGATLLGTVLAAPLGGDPERVLMLRTTLPALDGRRVLDARFAGAGVVLLGADHVLRFVDANGRETELDARAEAPLSVAGERVAYVRGEMPFFELARADVRTSAVEELTNGLAPVWSPALSADGTEVVFATSASGRPTLMRLRASGDLETLPSARTPSSPHAPQWDGDLLTFEDEAGRVTLDVTGNAP
jgi:hypothetical protein